MFFFCCIGWFEEKLITLPDDVNFLNQFVINLLFFLMIVKSKKFIVLFCSNSYVNCRFLWYKLKVLMTSSTCSVFTQIIVSSTFTSFYYRYVDDTIICDKKINKDSVVNMHQNSFNHQFDWEGAVILDNESNYEKRLRHND